MSNAKEPTGTILIEFFGPDANVTFNGQVNELQMFGAATMIEGHAHNALAMREMQALQKRSGIDVVRNLPGSRKQ